MQTLPVTYPPELPVSQRRREIAEAIYAALGRRAPGFSVPLPLALALALAILWSAVTGLLRLPSRLTFASRARRRARGS